MTESLTQEMTSQINGEATASVAESALLDPIALLGNVEIEGAVELGRMKLLLGEIMKLGPGQVLQLEKMVGDPVELTIKEKLIVCGEVVIIDEKFGLRITEIVSPGA